MSSRERMIAEAGMLGERQFVAEEDKSLGQKQHRVRYSRGNIADAHGAHPVRGKDRSPPDSNNSFLRTNFLPINADLGRKKEGSSCL